MTLADLRRKGAYMKWQEYQEAVVLLYEQADGIGKVYRNIYLPDQDTGQRRQVDLLLEVDAKGHQLRILIDAKYRRGKVNVKHLEEVVALSKAVGANKSVLVAANGWSKPAEIKAQYCGTDLVLLNVDEALELVVPDRWQTCPCCETDCMVLDHDGSLEFDDGSVSIYLAGQCRSCRLAFLWCWACGDEGHLRPGQSHTCGCGHKWYCAVDEMEVQPADESEALKI